MCKVRKHIVAVQGQFRVILGHWFWCQITNRKRVCDFLLVFNSNFGPILHRFGDTAVNRPYIGRKIAKIASSNPPQSHKCPRWRWPLANFLTSHLVRQWSHGAVRWWRNHEALSVLMQYRLWLTDGQTDGHVAVANIRCTHSVARITRKLCYPKDNRAVCPIHGCPENFRDSLATPTATIPNIFHGLLFRSTLWMFLQNLKSIALPVLEIIGTQKIWAVPGYDHAPFSPKFLMGFYLDWPCKCTYHIWSP